MGINLQKQEENIISQTQMKVENMVLLEVYWYETFNTKTKVIPTYIEALILQNFMDENGKLPRWNVAF